MKSKLLTILITIINLTKVNNIHSVTNHDGSLLTTAQITLNVLSTPNDISSYSSEDYVKKL